MAWTRAGELRRRGRRAGVARPRAGELRHRGSGSSAALAWPGLTRVSFAVGAAAACPGELRRAGAALPRANELRHRQAARAAPLVQRDRSCSTKPLVGDLLLRRRSELGDDLLVGGQPDPSVRHPKSPPEPGEEAGQ
ncbi:unnamed protein product [Urochloa humidicola]